MDERHKKPGWAFWGAVAIALPVLYVASFGPACWLVRDSRSRIVFGMNADFYTPLIRAANLAPSPLRDAVGVYSGNGKYGYSTMLDFYTALLDRKFMWL